jgi:hypothetical protein
MVAPKSCAGLGIPTQPTSAGIKAIKINRFMMFLRSHEHHRIYPTSLQLEGFQFNPIPPNPLRLNADGASVFNGFLVE